MLKARFCIGSNNIYAAFSQNSTLQENTFLVLSVSKIVNFLIRKTSSCEMVVRKKMQRRKLLTTNRQQAEEAWMIIAD